MINHFKIILLCLFFLVSCSDQNQSNETLDSEQGLSQKHKYEFRKELIEVTDDIYVGIGYGIANSIMIETENNLVIVDTLGSTESAEVLYKDFRKISEKPIIAIIYTHNHLDHLGGATVFFEESKTEIYAQENIIYNLDNIATTIRPIILERTNRQFGIPLPDEEIVHQGIGGFMEINSESTFGLVRPTKLFKDELKFEVDGLTFILAHVPGETDDHLYVWLPDKNAVMVGDNFYRSFANLYAIRGTKFRNPMEWVQSLDKIRMLNAEYLLPSHSRPISGTENVSKALTDYRDGIQFVHDQTIRYINKGLTPDEIVEKVKLPEHLANSPYLQEFYGSISSYIRSTFSGYIGWFSGNISDLHPLTKEQRAIKLSEMAQKQTKILDEALNAFSAGEYQWSMELADMLLAINKDDDKAKEIKSSAADKLSNYQSASNDYYFYKTVAAELRDEFIISADNNKATPDQLRATPMDAIMKSLPVNLNPEKAINIIQTVSFSFSDNQETFTIKIRKGVAELSLLPAEKNDLKIYSDQQTIKETLAGLRNIASISLSLANDNIQVEGGNIEFLKFLGLFTD